MEVYRWTPVAMVRITAFLAAGILLGIPGWCGIMPSLYGFLIAAILFYHCALRKQKLAAGTFGLTAVMMAGLHLGSGWNASETDGHLTRYQGDLQFYLAQVEAPPERIRTGNRIPVHIRAIRDTNGWELRQTRSHLLTGADPPAVIHGEWLLIRGMPKRVSPPGNPNEFDYKSHLERQGVFYRHTIHLTDLTVLTGPEKNFSWLAAAGRMACIRRIESLVRDPQAAAITLALLIGITDGIDPELITSYAATGTLHVLAVSGMHVGVIYWLVLQLLRPLRRLKNADRLIAFAAILLLWTYAMVTGLSPSVLRAVVMCSFMALTKPFRLRTEMNNTLAASAFLLMLNDPLIITRAGFQLSFFAVTGILVINRSLHQKLEPETNIGAWCWSIACVSVSAQYFTLPLTLYLFNQFPVWFIPANLIIIPLSFAVMGLGILLLMAGSIPIAGPWIASLTGWMVNLMNHIAAFMEELPFAVISDIHLTGMQAILLFLLLITLLILIRTRHSAWIIVASVMASGFCWIDVHKFNKAASVTGFTVYRQSRITSIDIRNGAHVIHLGGPADVHSLRNNLAERTEIIQTTDGRSIRMARYAFGNDTLVYLNAVPPPGETVRGRWLVIGSGAKGLSMTALRTPQVIAGSEVNPYEANRMEKTCHDAGIAFHWTSRDGAFIHQQLELRRLD